ncbi:MAG TPA: DUF177 domain-containing protein [Vicinamibacteria bacterium]
MSTTQNMLVLSIRDIPPEGKPIDVPLDPGAVHLEGEDEFALVGGRLVGRVEKGEDEAVHFRGRLQAQLGLHCGRCLEAFVKELDEDLDLFFMPRGAQPDADEEEQEVELSDRDMVVAYYDHDRIDLGEMVREQMHLALPLRRLCREDCRGLCPSCGVNRNTGSCDCQPTEAVEDERLAPLRKIFDKGSS